MNYLITFLLLPLLITAEVILTESRRRIASYLSDTTSHDSNAEATGFEGFGDFGGFRGFDKFHGALTHALGDLDGQFDTASGFEGAQAKKFETDHAKFSVPDDFGSSPFGHNLAVKTPSHVLPYSAHEQHGSPKKSPYKAVYGKSKTSYSPAHYSAKPTAYTHASPKPVSSLYSASDNKKYSPINDVTPSYGPSSYSATPAHLIQYSHYSDGSPLGITSQRYEQNLYQRQIHKSPYDYGNFEGIDY